MSADFEAMTVQMGLNVRNARGPHHLDDETPGPYDPWCAKVMVLAGVARGIPWLFLACRDCGWWLGYSAQYDPAALAKTADKHAAECEVQS